jgi:hypothetical protein
MPVHKSLKFYFLAEEVEWFIALFVQLAGSVWLHVQSA